jgi:Flp pilus assembly pilin Flp
MARRQRGQAFAEYAVGLAIIAAVLVPAVALASAPIVGLFASTTSAIANVAGIADTAAPSPAPTALAIASPTASATAAPSPGATPSASSDPAASGSPIPVAQPTATASPAPTDTASPTSSAAPTASASPASSASDSATPAPTTTPGPATTASPTATPETLEVAWTFGPGCDGWTNATWTGTGCAAASSPQVMTSPIVPLVGSGTQLRVVAIGGTTNPQNLEMKLRDYAGNTSTIQLAPLASGNGAIDVTIGIAPGTTAFGLTAQGPGEIDAASVYLLP